MKRYLKDKGGNQLSEQDRLAVSNDSELSYSSAVKYTYCTRQPAKDKGSSSTQGLNGPVFQLQSTSYRDRPAAVTGETGQ